MNAEAGKLRHRVRVESKQSGAVDSSGDSLPDTWVTVKDGVPAAVEPLSAREFLQAQAIQSGVSARITLRALSVPTLDASMRIVHRGKIYNIAGVLPDKESGLDYLTLPVSEGVNQG